MKLNPKDAKQLLKIRKRIKERKTLQKEDPTNSSHRDSIDNNIMRETMLMNKYRLNDETASLWIDNSLNRS